MNDIVKNIELAYISIYNSYGVSMNERFGSRTVKSIINHKQVPHNINYCGEYESDKKVDVQPYSVLTSQCPV